MRPISTRCNPRIRSESKTQRPIGRHPQNTCPHKTLITLITKPITFSSQNSKNPLKSPMATIAAMAMLNAKCFGITSPPTPSKPTAMKPISLLSLQSLPKGLVTSDVPNPSPITSTAIAGAIFSTLSYSDAAFAAQQIADIAEGDNRGLALLLPIVPAIGWVLFNILQPALNQLNRMRIEKGFVIGVGLGGGLAAAGWLLTPEASAGEIGMIAEASSSSDSRGLLLLFVVTPAILWVLYNILQPALNQLNKMRSE